MNTYKSLYEFIDRAVRNRNYAPNTAYGLKAALKLFEAEANEEEKSSLEKFEERLPKIYSEVCRKNSKYNASSLESYYTRVKKVIKEFHEYGSDPTKLASWNRKSVLRGPRSQKKNAEEGAAAIAASIENSGREGNMVLQPSTQKAEIPLASGASVIIYMPKERDEKDNEKIRKFVEFLIG